MIPAWPATVRELPRRRTWVGGPQTALHSFQPAYGPSQDRPAITGEVEVYSAVFPSLTDAMRTAFRDWVRDDLVRGSRSFARRDPVTGEVGLWKIVPSDRALYTLTANGAGLHDLSLTLMRLAGAPWWAPYVLDGEWTVPSLVADYAAGIFGVDGVKTAAAAVAAVTGTFDIYSTRWDAAEVAEPGRVVSGATRANLFEQSEVLTNAAWGKSAVTISANVAVAPDGAPSADKVVEDATTGDHYVSNPHSWSSGLTYTMSVFAKAVERQHLQLVLNSAAFGSTKVAGFTLAGAGASVVSAGATAGIERHESDWYRCWVTATSTAAVSAAPQIRLATSLTTTLASYAGDGSSGLYVWGGQLETAPAPTYYIPTGAASATAPDVIPATAPIGIDRIVGFAA